MDSTLAKGLAVLEWLARQQRDCRLVEVAQAFGLARSNAHRTLQTLVECGWVQQNTSSSTYRPSLRLFELGALVEDGLDLKSLIHPLLAQLAQSSGEAIHLTVLEGTEIIYLDKFDSPLPVAAYSRIGGRAPAYCVASGKALLAAIGHDASSLRALFGKLVPHTPHTLTDIEALQAELLRSRARGWAENRQEWRLGVCGLGAPIFNARGQAVAAIGISVPSIRFQRAQARTLSEQLIACARDASQLLGYFSGGENTSPSLIATQRRHS
ncbi:MAG: IclR family transcriptional regulator [Hylemonella sp.]|jgi:DNA-binding IclR family transcriptional regulator